MVGYRQTIRQQGYRGVPPRHQHPWFNEQNNGVGENDRRKTISKYSGGKIINIQWGNNNNFNNNNNNNDNNNNSNREKQNQKRKKKKKKLAVFYT